jgi:hypothetical protein
MRTMTPYQRELDRRRSLPGNRNVEVEQKGDFVIRRDPYHEAQAIGAIVARRIAEGLEKRRRDVLVTRYLQSIA